MIKNTQDVQFQYNRGNDLEMYEEGHNQNTDKTDYNPSIQGAMDQRFSQITLSAKIQLAITSSISSTMRFKDIPYMQQGAVT